MEQYVTISNSMLQQIVRYASRCGQRINSVAIVPATTAAGNDGFCFDYKPKVQDATSSD